MTDPDANGGGSSSTTLNSPNQASDQRPLAPASDIQKFLISTTCRMAGTLNTPGMLIAEASPGLSNWATYQRLRASEDARTMLALVFRTDPAQQGRLIIPQYDGAADMICSLLSLRFGKRFDLHGATENSGFFGMPDFRHLGRYSDIRLPQNGDVVRADFPASLELDAARVTLPFLFGPLAHGERMPVFRSAAKFYQQALRAVEQDVESAYLHLISAGEILTAEMDLPADALVDCATRKLIERVETEMAGGKDAGRIIRNRLRSVKRRFVVGLNSLIEPDFFARGDARQSYGRPTRETFTQRLGAAYDLRSRYIHTGRAFGAVVGPRGTDFDEVQVGQPMNEDREQERALGRAPTFIGLERILRYCLLRYAETLGLPLRENDAASELSAS